MLRPIHMIRSSLTRLGQGEFGVTLDLPPGDEFGELGTFFNTVSPPALCRSVAARRSESQPGIAGRAPRGRSRAVQSCGGAAVHESGDAVDVDARERREAGQRAARGGTRVSNADRGNAGVAPIARTRADRRGPARHRARDPWSQRGAGRHPAGRPQPRLRVSHAVDDCLLTQARGAGPVDCRHCPRGEEPAQRDDDSPRAAADEDPQELPGARWVAAGCSPIPQRRTRACSST